MPTTASSDCHPLQQPPKYQQLFRPLGASHQAMASKLTDSSKFKVTVKSDTDIPAIVFVLFFCLFFVCFVCFVLFIFFLSYFFIYCFLFFSFFSFFFLSYLSLFCFFSLIYVHVKVHTYKPGHSILGSLDKSV